MDGTDFSGSAPPEVRFMAEDGFALAGTLYLPRRANGRAVLLSGAYAVPRRYYSAYAQFLADAGFSVFIYDYRGIGGSGERGWRGEPIRQRHWGERDLPAALAWLGRQAPEQVLLAVGHSAGGYLPALATNNHRIGAMLTIASQSGYWGLRDGWRKWLACLYFHALIPAGAQLAHRLPALRRGSFAAPLGAALRWARWGRHAQYFCDESGAPLPGHYASFTAPVRAYHFTDDLHFAPPRAVQALRAFYPNAKVQIAPRAPEDYGAAEIGHFGFFRREMPREAWEETARWLLEIEPADVLASPAGRGRRAAAGVQPASCAPGSTFRPGSLIPAPLPVAEGNTP